MFQGVTTGGSGRVESREKMEMAEKGVLIPVGRRPIYTVGKHQRVKKMGVSLAGRGTDNNSAASDDLSCRLRLLSNTVPP